MSTALDPATFDASIRPQDDLFRHVNGPWLARTPIDADKASAGAFVVLRDESEAAVRQIIDDLASGVEQAAEGSDQARVRDLYASFMDDAKVEAAGAAPLTPLLERVDAVTTPAELARLLGWNARFGVGGLYDMGTDADPGDPNRYVMFLVQDGLGLPDEVYYRDDSYAEIRAQYRDHVATMLKLAGVEDADAQADAVLELETAIASHHWDRVRTRDLVQMYNLQPFAEFAAASPALLWDEFLAGAGVTAEQLGEVVNCQPSFFSEVADLFTDERLPQWRAWARWNAISSIAPYLSSDFVNERFNFYGRILNGTEELRARWKRGVALTEGVLGEAIGKIYVQRHFPGAAKQRMDELVANLIKAYGESISALEWMGEQTRAQALDKLAKFTPKIGYPAKWRDYSALQIDADDLIGNVLRSDEFEFNHDLKKLTEPVDPDEWEMYPQTVNAYYHPLRNEIVFPAAILQPPFFYLDGDDAVNYGSIGAVIGHEIGHGFDDQGSTCDGDGRLRNWWTDADRDAFTQRTASLVSQYDALVPAQLVGTDNPQHVNGELTLGENIGDLGGLSIAYLAWQLAVGDPASVPAIDGLTGPQRFFLSWAESWQGKMRDEALRQRLTTDPHSPDEFRCNQIVKNLDAFVSAFGVEEGDELYLAPGQRVSIW